MITLAVVQCETSLAKLLVIVMIMINLSSNTQTITIGRNINKMIPSMSRKMCDLETTLCQSQTIQRKKNTFKAKRRRN